MNMSMLLGVMTRPKRRPARAGIFLLTLLLLAGCLLWPAGAQATPDARCEARVTIISNVTEPTLVDQVAIRLMGVEDRNALDQILSALAVKFNAQPANLDFTVDNVYYPDQKGQAVEFNMSVVPRHEQYLPIAPFIEAFAPYASRLRIAYAVKGEYTYRGYRNPYADKDVAFTVRVTPGPNPEAPEAFYSMDVAIKNPALTSVQFLNYPEQGKRPQQRNNVHIALAAGAAIIILALGLFLALLLPNRKGKAKAQQLDQTTTVRETPTGGTHD